MDALTCPGHRDAVRFMFVASVGSRVVAGRRMRVFVCACRECVADINVYDNLIYLDGTATQTCRLHTNVGQALGGHSANHPLQCCN